MNSVDVIKMTEQAYFAKLTIKATSESTLRHLSVGILWSLDHVFSVIRSFKMDKAKRHQYWTFEVGCSMFNVHFFKKILKRDNPERGTLMRSEVPGSEFKGSEAQITLNGER
jgi:hypothetical protein